MSYILLNGTSQKYTRHVANNLKSTLLDRYGREVIIVSDFMSDTARGQAMYEEITSPTIRPHRALSLILEQRKALINHVILPAKEQGKSVIYIGGVLDDDRYVQHTEFHVILQENQEMLQSIGGHTYPIGAVYAKEGMGGLGLVRDYVKKVDRLKQSMAGLKTSSYTRTFSAIAKVNEMFS